MSNELTLTWDKELSNFFKEIGLVETSECLNSELIVLSRHRLEKLPEALEALVEKLLKTLEKHIDAKEQLLNKHEKEHEDLLVKKRTYASKEEEEEEEERERAKRFNSEQVQIRATTKEVDQRIDTFIQAKRNELDESNRTEFLNRRDPAAADVTCARTDAREINRNIQMKFDIVNNEDGPLARSLITSSNTANTKDSHVNTSADITERLNNIEEHLNVKIDEIAKPSFSVFERIKILENTLIEIEKQYPLWAAVHFNQPNPPQQTVLKAHGRANSSLTRAVIDQLNRQKQISVTKQTIESTNP
ncbi:uncharacterized protein BX663DRAFT_540599 [Cokeromyces recurvatus]|uniref:uncharacterized protein n=1 Tax=Cokeromyces recurvatus TaxID=90255 RepID=UPI0022200362|nr:uncharacterized protein BX663DRAFT_540599 [Cokeromyces recurvatus]KAI7905929.1 hypothetical protein BX663DRAFT_540599 [Cokeromyces recurvatus]